MQRPALRHKTTSIASACVAALGFAEAYLDGANLLNSSVQYANLSYGTGVLDFYSSLLSVLDKQPINMITLVSENASGQLQGLSVAMSNSAEGLLFSFGVAVVAATVAVVSNYDGINDAIHKGEEKIAKALIPVSRDTADNLRNAFSRLRK